VELKVRQQLEAPNRKIRTVYFPDAGLCSIVGMGAGHRHQAEVGIVGREGMTGISLLLGADRSPHATFMLTQGRARCLGADELLWAMSESRSLAACLLRFAHVHNLQIAHTAVANARYKIEERLARWLLMADDRLDGEDVLLTHDMLATMLATRRAGVTAALNKFEDDHLIRSKRARISLLDRDGLMAIADGLYGAPEAEYNRLFRAPAQETR